MYKSRSASSAIVVIAIEAGVYHVAAYRSTSSSQSPPTATPVTAVESVTTIFRLAGFIALAANLSWCPMGYHPTTYSAADAGTALRLLSGEFIEFNFI